MLNGYARVIEFGTFSKDFKLGQLTPNKDPVLNYIVSITEGAFKNGEPTGYARRINNDGTCWLGFWNANMPFGKFAVYNSVDEVC